MLKFIEQASTLASIDTGVSLRDIRHAACRAAKVAYDGNRLRHAVTLRIDFGGLYPGLSMAGIATEAK